MVSFLFGLLLGVSTIGLFLSLWIFIPAPIFALLPLSVGAPEVSPWLLLVNWGLAAVTLGSHRGNGLFKLTIAANVLAIVLALWPLLQLPIAHSKITQEFRQTFNHKFLNSLAPERQQHFRKMPFRFREAFLGLTEPRIREVHDIVFSVIDRVSLRLNIYQPEKTGYYPGIVMVYGGAWQRGQPKNMEKLGRYLAQQGYVVWAIDYRHAPKSQFPNQLKDIHAALEYLKTHAQTYETNLDRVAILGQSAGAQLALVTAYQPAPIDLRAVVAYYSPVDLTAGYYDVPTPDPINSRDVLEKFLGGNPQQFPDRYRQASPLQWVTRSQIPTFLIYGGKDNVVQSRFGKALHEKLLAHNSTSLFLEIPWADHAFDAVFNGVSNQLALYHLERFLAELLH
ncbi:alpha/beta hydrolase fold domain-containing protein [Alkalinema pantanalense CENA528]|uniref:alpha/beta hydrolase fold domain-containing protein n=1 Tax=Alkalinema pantanalense TaxID=1620705 RepID=UPI003D6DE874